MKEYGELRYLELFEEYDFKSKQGTATRKAKRRNDVEVLNILANFGWRVISKDDNQYLMERDVT